MTDHGRRTFLGFGLFASALGALRPRAALAIAPARPTARGLALSNLHTGERVETVYWVDGRPVPEALREIDWVLRDHRTDEARPIDIRLLHCLNELRSRLDTRGPFEVLSGYRSPATNAMLSETSPDVAPASLHLQGMAADVRVRERSLRHLRNAALGLGRGGVGYYPRSGFVHVDVGRVRAW